MLSRILEMYQFVFCLSAMLPYIGLSVLRFPAQVQPWSSLAGWAAMLVFTLRGVPWRLSIADKVLMALSLFFMVYVGDMSDVDLFAYVRRSMGFFFSIGILLFGRTVSPRQLRRAALVALAAYSLVGGLHYVSRPAFLLIADFFIPERNNDISEIGERGTESLCPEATDFGFTVVFLGLFVVMADQAERTGNLRKSWIGAILSFICVGLSKSASGAFAGVGVLLTIGIGRRFRAVWGVVLAVVLLLAVLVNVSPSIRTKLDEFRGTRVLISAVTSPSELIQTSFVHRYVHNLAGVYGFVDSYGLGFGACSWTNHAADIYSRKGLGTDLNMTAYHKKAVVEILDTAPVGVIAMMLLEYGIFGLAFIVVTYSIAFRSSIFCKWAAIVLLMMSWLQSFPVAYPPFWLLLSLCENPAFAVPRGEESQPTRKA